MNVIVTEEEGGETAMSSSKRETTALRLMTVSEWGIADELDDDSRLMKPSHSKTDEQTLPNGGELMKSHEAPKTYLVMRDTVVREGDGQVSR